MGPSPPPDAAEQGWHSETGVLWLQEQGYGKNWPVPSTRVRQLVTTCNSSSKYLTPSFDFLGYLRSHVQPPPPYTYKYV